MNIHLFRDCWTDEVRGAPGRAEALVAGITGVGADDVHRVDLRAIAKSRSDISGHWHLDPMLPYGGVREWERND